MSSVAVPDVAGLRPGDPLEVLFEEVAELVGQRDAIDGRLVEIVAEIDGEGLCGITGGGYRRARGKRSAWNRALNPNLTPNCGPLPDPAPSITKTTTEDGSCYRLTLGHHDAAKFDAALQSQLDAAVAEWRRDHPEVERAVPIRCRRFRAPVRRCIWGRCSPTPNASI